LYAHDSINYKKGLNIKSILKLIKKHIVYIIII